MLVRVVNAARYNQRLFRVIRSVLGNDAEAEDALQEAWVRAYEHLNQFEGRAGFATWITRIAYHEALARTRSSKRWRPLENSGREIMAEADRRRTTSVTPESEVMRGELGHLLQAAVDSLPDTYRSVFVLRGSRALEHHRNRRMPGTLGRGRQDPPAPLARNAPPGIGEGPRRRGRPILCIPRRALRPDGRSRPRANPPRLLDASTSLSRCRIWPGFRRHSR